jgi:hypothetical protein
VLFAFSGFADDSQGVLTTVYQFALVLSELVFEAFHRSLGSLHHVGRRFELLVAVCADGKKGSLTNLLYDPHGSFFHAPVSHRPGRFAIPVEIKRHHYPHAAVNAYTCRLPFMPLPS